MSAPVRLHTIPPGAGHWLEALPLAVIGVDPAGRAAFLNGEAAELLAGAARAVLGRRLDEIFAPDAALQALVERARASGARLAESDVELSGPGLALGRATVAAAAVGESGFVALVITPYWPPKRPPQSGAWRTLAHEIRNPLAGIRAAAQLMGRGGDEEMRGLSRLICDEVDRVGRLTDQIDPLGAPGAMGLARVNVHEALDRVRALVSSSAPELAIRERYDPSLPPVRGDLDQLIQAFLNIAKNAAEAIGPAPEGEIVLATLYRPGVRVRANSGAAPRTQLEVRIIDNGPGLDPAIADRVFEAFATTKRGGMGLGLAVAADIIARHDGRIEVESQPGRTLFKVSLPVDAEPAP